MTPERTKDLLQQYGVGPIQFSGTHDALYERHLIFDHLVDVKQADVREQFEAAARSVRDVISQRWLLTEQTYAEKNPKRVYYLSMEFLIGRSLANNMTNLPARPVGGTRLPSTRASIGLALDRRGTGCRAGQRRPRTAGRLLPRFDGHDAASGAWAMACATSTASSSRRSWMAGNMSSRTTGCDVRIPGRSRGRNEAVEVKLNCSFELRGGQLRPVLGRPSTLIGIPFDRPVVGYGGKTINTLRLWAAATPDYFDFQEFSSGDFVGALAETLTAESLTRVLYPDDSTAMGQGLRFVQEYFLVACSLARSRTPLSPKQSATGMPFRKRSPSNSMTRIRPWPFPS